MSDGIRQSVDKRTCTAFVPMSPEPVFCTENERCRGCPYPSADYGAASGGRNSSAIINAEKWAATQAIELKRNAAGSYTATVTDDNEVLGDYNFAANSGSGITFTRKGNTLTITATAAAAKNLDTEKTYSATGSAYEIDPDRAVICWYDRTGRYQAMASYIGVGRDPVKAYIKIKAVEEKGSLTINKVDATGAPLAGVELLLETSADGKTWTEVGRVTTDSTGVAKWENLKIDVQYRVMETKAPAGYTLLTEPLFAGVGQQADDHIDPDLRLGFGKFRVGGVLVILLQRLQVLPLDVVDLDGRIPVDQVADHDVELFQRHRIEVCPLFQRLPLHGRGDDGTHGGNDDDHCQIAVDVQQCDHTGDQYQDAVGQLQAGDIVAVHQHLDLIVQCGDIVPVSYTHLTLPTT